MARIGSFRKAAAAESRLARWRGGAVTAAAVAAAAGTLGGCTIDCDDTYCDFIRAGATGVYAYELACCRDPDGLQCADRELRMYHFSLKAIEMRRACEEENWQRLGEIWDSIKPLIPLGVLLLVANDFCDGWGWAAHNLTSPFGPEDTAVMAIDLDPAPPRLQVARSSAEPIRSAATTTIDVEHTWNIRSGSMMTLDVFGTSATGLVEGSFTAMETMPVAGAQHDQQVEEWCRRMKPRNFDLDVPFPDGHLILRLDPDFAGNHVRFESADRGVIGVAMTIESVLDAPPLPIIENLGDLAYLEIPFALRPDGGLTLAPDGAMSLLDLWPVDPAVEAFVRGEDASGFANEDDDLACIARAREVAEGFLALHPVCGAAGGG
jgi:hypothetical protein